MIPLRPPVSRGPIDPGSTSVPLRLPAPDAVMLTRRAIEAAEALHLLAGTLAAPFAFHAAARLDQRREEARGALQILGATLEDTGDSLRRDAAWTIAGVLVLGAPGLDDLVDFEAWCRDVAAERDTLPPSERDPDGHYGAAREAE